MRIRIDQNAACGNLIIPSGEYMVALRTDIQQFQLTGAGQDYTLPAIRRKSSSKVRTETVSFYSGGGRTWTLLIQTPKFGEWIAMLELGAGK